MLSQAENQSPETAQAILQRFHSYRQDPWLFLTECVRTLDPVDKDNPVKAFPQWTYLKFFAKLWHRGQFIAIPKSRRMTMSWTNCALILWDILFHQGRNWAIVSKKEEDAAEILRRIDFIYENIPSEKIPRDLLPERELKVKPPVLEFPEIRSRVQGYPMGADQLRQFTFSGIFGDECAFWPEAQKFYSAAKPTTDGGGKMVLVSSAAPGFFKKLVFDTLDTEEDLSDPPVDPQTPLPGTRFWVNPKNKFAILEVHYSANEAKRDPTFKETIKSSMPLRDFLQEYEIKWDSFQGLPVYADFNPQVHLTKEKLEPKLGLPLLCGVDFGLTGAVLVGQLQEDQLVLLREFTAQNKPISVFIPEVLQQLKITYPEWTDPERDFRWYIDPSGTFRKDTDATTCAKVMYDCGVRRIFPGDVTWEARKNAVEYFLIRQTRKGPALTFNEKDCPKLSKGFRGGYQYPESAGEIEPQNLRPLKNEFSHIHDALQYLAGGVRQILRSGKSTSIPTPEYTFNQSTYQQKGNIVYGYKKII